MEPSSRVAAFALLIPVAIASCDGKPAGASREPAFAFGPAGGCGDFTLYRANEDRTEVLVVQVRKDKLGLPPAGPKTFDLAAPPDGLTVHIDLYTRPPRHFPYCTDMIDPEAEKPVPWTARAGTARLSVSEPAAVEPGRSRTYKATVRLEGLVVEGPGGKRAGPKEAIVLEADVGWIP